MTIRAQSYTAICAAPYQWRPVGFLQMSVSSSVATLLTTSANATVTTNTTLVANPTIATYAMITVDSNGVRFRDDGVAPTNTVGVLIAAGAAPFQYNGDLTTVQFISNNSSAAAILNVSYYD